MSDDFKNNLELALGNAKRLSNKILILLIPSFI